MTLSITALYHYAKFCFAECHNAERHNAECGYEYVGMNNVVLLSVAAPFVEWRERESEKEILLKIYLE